LHAGAGQIRQTLSKSFGPGPEQKTSEEKPRKRIQHAQTQSQNDESVLDVAPILKRVVPAIKHLNERAKHTGQQNKGSNQAGDDERPHRIGFYQGNALV
jgi:hypothetical protein